MQNWWYRNYHVPQIRKPASFIEWLLTATSTWTVLQIPLNWLEYVSAGVYFELMLYLDQWCLVQWTWIMWMFWHFWYIWIYIHLIINNRIKHHNFMLKWNDKTNQTYVTNFIVFIVVSIHTTHMISFYVLWKPADLIDRC